MSLWRYPRTAAALCIAAVLACAAAPAAFLAASDAAYFGRVETVADPYRAPTPTADDYYILRQLAARGQDTTARQTTPQQEQDAAPQTPKVYIGASASIESMTWADTATTTAAENALWQLAESSAVPRFWVEQTVGDTVDYGSYTDANGQYYNLNSAYCTTDSLGFVTVRKFARENDTLFTRYSITMDGPHRHNRRGVVLSARRRCRRNTSARRGCPAQLCGPGRAGKPGRLGRPRKQPLRLRPVQRQRRRTHHGLDPPLHLHRLYCRRWGGALVLQFGLADRTADVD